MSSPVAEPRATPVAGPPVLSVRQRNVVFGTIMLGMLLAALDQTIVSTAIRTIADDLQGFSIQAWATTAYLITSTISTPLYGKLSDMFGRKQFFLFAIAIFIVGSALCGIAQNMYELAAFRALQGLGAGGLFSLALAIVGDIVPPRERAKYQGYFLAVFGTSSVLGPVLGGFFAGADSVLGITGWRWVFWINVPIGLFAMAVVTRFLHLPVSRNSHRIDWPGAAALVVALVPLLTVAEQGRTWGWGSGRSLACYVIGVTGLVAFILAERAYGDEALLPLRLFRSRTFSVANTSSAILGMAMFGGLLVLPLYLQVVKGSSPTKAGLQSLPLMVGIVVGSIVAGQLIARTGRYRIFPIIGSVLMVIALFLFAQIGADTSLVVLMFFMLVMGLGLSFNMQPTVTAVQNAASPREIGVSTSAVTFFRQMGGTAGAAIFLSVLFSTLGGRIGDAVGKAQRTPEFAAALKAHPEQAAAIKGALGGPALDDTSFISRLDPVIGHPFKVGFAEAVDTVFLCAGSIMVVGLIVVWFLPELPLRKQSGMQARAEEDAAAAAE